MNGAVLRSSLIALLLALGAGPDAGAALFSSRKPKLNFPLDCTLGKDCWITRYMDRGLGSTVSDHACRRRSEDGHNGTDIAVSSFARLRAGVGVLAVAEATVERVRDAMPDRKVTVEERDDIAGRECGNGLVLDLGRDWQVQYCHLREGSLRVKPGDKVKAGDFLGEMGVSGLTEYPHLHITVRHMGVIVDPFGGGAMENGCDRRGPKPQLWRQPITEPSIVLLPPTFSAKPHTRASLWEPTAAELGTDAPALILNGRAFHARAGDTWDIRLIDPKGGVVMENRTKIEQDRQLQWRYAGVRRPPNGWMPGLWRGEVMVTRDGYPPSRSSITIVIQDRPMASVSAPQPAPPAD
ncbi:M23 family metallopeptidase [Pseudokordiimonas caeni]|uniref:M23 family metallopeptidase n=1 Tax=Pseudokordiimonas caeni TaxID=2997908 RepID=UPI002811D249|nr:M23 family metallopeptidase [Pseudokordiimonas caeni]